MGWFEMISDTMKKLGDAPYGVFRILVGLLFMLHGAQKWGILGMGEGFAASGFSSMFGVPVALAYAVYAIELAGGLLILLGLFTRTSAFLGSIVMIGALAIVHLPKGLNPLGSGGELPLMFLAAFLVIMMDGARVWSLEKALMKSDKY
jgi:putative oxidoreductase